MIKISVKEVFEKAGFPPSRVCSENRSQKKKKAGKN